MAPHPDLAGLPFKHTIYDTYAVHVHWFCPLIQVRKVTQMGTETKLPSEYERNNFNVTNNNMLVKLRTQQTTSLRKPLSVIGIALI